MSQQASTKLIGSFVLGAVALIVIVFVVFGSGKLFRKFEHYVIFFEGSVNGLKVGAPVKVRGVDIGSVSNIRGLMDSTGTFHVEVMIDTDLDAFEYLRGAEPLRDEMSQKEGLTLQIDRGVRAQLASQSIVTGQLYINIVSRPDTPVKLIGLNKKYRDLEMPSIPRPSEELQQNLHDIMTNFSKMPLLEVSQALLKTLNSIDSLVNSRELKRTVFALTETLRETEKVLKEMKQQVAPVSAGLVQASQDASEALDRTGKLMARLDNTVANDRYELQVALKEFAEANRSMRNLLDYLQRNPGSLIHGKN
jgi:paraquat-inducible protein B